MSVAGIIEFVGPTSSGKTTYVARLLRESEALGIPVVVADEALLGRLSRFLTARVLRSLFVDLAVMTRCLGSVIRCRKALAKIGRAALRRDDSLFMRLNLTRNAIKRLAMFDYLHRRDTGNIVIFDEGPLQACLNAFVHYEDGVDEAGLLEVAATLPIPATLVVMSASADAVVSRSVSRPDKAFEGLSDHHWTALKLAFERVLPKVLSENKAIDNVVSISSEQPLSSDEFWRRVGAPGVSTLTTSI